MNKIYLNNEVVNLQEARISVDERGFRFGDGVFETIPVHGGVPYLWEYHQERLEAGLSVLHIKGNTHNLLSQAQHLLKENKVIDGLVRIYISRGIGSQGYLPSDAHSPTTVIQTLPRPVPLASGALLWHSSYEKVSPRALPTHCKLAQGVNPTLARLEAQANGCHDALQLDAAGHMAEASSANIFWFKDGKLYTPSLACGALNGVTRRRIIELSPYPVFEGSYMLESLMEAQAVILTNASLGVVPIESLRPQGMHWTSTPLANEFIALRNQDIEKYTRRSGELLA
jgi:branched-subunit amino acid aminotransferase/4-amino-4-deoxychorismate lyase